MRPSTSAGVSGFAVCGRTSEARPRTAPANVALGFPYSACHESYGEACEEEEWWDYADPESLLDRASSMISELQQGWVQERHRQLSELCRDMEKQYGIRLSESERDALLRGSTDEIALKARPEKAYDLGESTRQIADAAEQVVKDAREQIEASRGMRRRLQDLASDVTQEENCTELENSESNSYLNDLQQEVTRLKAVQDVRNELRECNAHLVPSESEEQVRLATPNLSAFDAWLDKLHAATGSDASTSVAYARLTDPGESTGDSTARSSPSSLGAGATAVPTQWCGEQVPPPEAAPNEEAHAGIIYAGAALPGPAAHEGRCGRGEAGCAVGDVQRQLDEILSEFDEIDRIRDNICKITLT